MIPKTVRGRDVVRKTGGIDAADVADKHGSLSHDDDRISNSKIDKSQLFH